MLIGTLAVSEALRLMEQPVKKLASSTLIFSKQKIDNVVTFLEFKSTFPTIIKSSGLGTLIGAMPGLGSTIAAFLAYGEAKRSSKNLKILAKAL